MEFGQRAQYHSKWQHLVHFMVLNPISQLSAQWKPHSWNISFLTLSCNELYDFIRFDKTHHRILYNTVGAIKKATIQTDDVILIWNNYTTAEHQCKVDMSIIYDIEHFSTLLDLLCSQLQLISSKTWNLLDFSSTPLKGCNLGYLGIYWPGNTSGLKSIDNTCIKLILDLR